MEEEEWEGGERDMRLVEERITSSLESGTGTDD